MIETIESYNKKTGISITNLLSYAKLNKSKYYQWKRRYGVINYHNSHIPRSHWILESEKKSIIEYAKSHMNEEGYRRLCYKMLDENIVAVSPSTAYRVLKKANLISRFKSKPSSKGNGFIQPTKPHEHWHIDISYIKVLRENYFLISIIDGYSRYIVNHSLKGSMETFDIEIVLQEALEKYKDAKPRIISDNGSQFISNEFKEFIRYHGLTHIRTSIRYPESNGKKERFYQTLKKEHVRKISFLSFEDAKIRIANYIDYYNTERLHSAIDFLTPEDILKGRRIMRLQERKEKLQFARERRKIYHENEKTSLFRYG